MTLNFLNNVRTPRKVFTSPTDVIEALEIPFSSEQLEAICAPLEPGVIIAGAGSGKTTVMAARVVWLVGSAQVRPDQVLGLTFTRKAATELSQRIRAALEKSSVLAEHEVAEQGEQVVLTYDSFAARVVGEHGLRLGYDADPLMITGAARFKLAAGMVAQAAGPFKFLSRLRPSTVTERVLQLDSEIQAHLVDLEQFSKQADWFRSALAAAPLNNRKNVYAAIKTAQATLEERAELLELVGSYQNLKKELGLVEFADQMAMAAQLVRHVPQVAVTLREQFSVVLLDEYQDTSSAQVQFLRGLFSGSVPSQGRGHPVTAVGDPFQAIYGWRGAAAANILAFATDFPTRSGEPASSFSLTVNRRSGANILTCANQIAESLRNDPALGVAGDGSLLRAAENKPAGRVIVGQFSDWPSEVEWLAEAIVTMHELGPTDAGVARWSDIAVLTRRNTDIAAVYAALVNKDVPCEIVGLGGLLELPEIADIVATLRLLDDVTANADLIRLLTGPRWAIGKKDLALLGSRAYALAKPKSPPQTNAESVADALEKAVREVDPSEVVSLLDAIDDLGDQPYCPAARKRFIEFGNEIRLLRQHADEPVLDLVRKIISTLGLDIELLATPEHLKRGGRRNLSAFVDAVASYVDLDGDCSISGLLTYLKVEQEQGIGLEQVTPSLRDSVKLLTVHKAKGLEWEVVCLPALVDETFPSTKVSDDWVRNSAVLPASLRGDAAEVPQLGDVTQTGLSDYHHALKVQSRRSEDRLAYVAATRARRLLIGSAHWWRPSSAQPRMPSPYLLVLRDHADSVVRDDPAPLATDSNPLTVEEDQFLWPQQLEAEAFAKRREIAEEVTNTMTELNVLSVPPQLDDARIVHRWDKEIDQLLLEANQARQRTKQVMLPPSLTATQLMIARQDPVKFAADLIRPMPKPPSRAQRFGTKFHEWIEHRFNQQILPDLDHFFEDEVADATDDDEDFDQLCLAFSQGQFAERSPYCLEYPFTLVLGEAAPGYQLRGRMDAVYRDGAYWLVVDWKTSQRQYADPIQLAIYRIAWAEIVGVELESVKAGFYFVRTDTLQCASTLLTRADLAAELTGLVHPTGTGERT